ncbi:MAG TPA: response regulator, partial [Candidatus Limnocylindrales bacterium]|nr:response regulator [Candidatus Limnocylindrales bacterium]
MSGPAHPGTARQCAQPGGPATTEPVPAPRRRVLIVEDDPSNRLLLAQVLARAGFDTVEAADGDEGLRQARSERPDLVVLDLGLPRVDGFEVCRRLRAD